MAKALSSKQMKNRNDHNACQLKKTPRKYKTTWNKTNVDGKITNSICLAKR